MICFFVGIREIQPQRVVSRRRLHENQSRSHMATFCLTAFTLNQPLADSLS